MNPTADILAHLDAIDALAAKATERRWHQEDVTGEKKVANSDFIAASRDGWPATVKALRVAVEALRVYDDPFTQPIGDEATRALAAVRSMLKGEQP